MLPERLSYQELHATAVKLSLALPLVNVLATKMPRGNDWRASQPESLILVTAATEVLLGLGCCSPRSPSGWPEHRPSAQGQFSVEPLAQASLFRPPRSNGIGRSWPNIDQAIRAGDVFSALWFCSMKAHLGSAGRSGKNT